MSHENPEMGSFPDLAGYRLQVAQEDLDTARENFERNRLRAANNRAYYAIYHAITAVLAFEPVAFKSHKITLGYFNKEYVRTEIFPRELGHQISIAQAVRHSSDYDEFYIASRTKTEKQIACADTLIKEVKKYLKKKNQEKE